MYESRFPFHISETEHQLIPVGRSREMTADDVDFQMQENKSRKILEISDMGQKTLEYFVQKYGESYQYLKFTRCPLISDFSPLEDLPALEEIHINWNIRAEKLWNMKRNPVLKHIRILDAKRLTLRLPLLQTSDTLETVSVFGGANRYPMESLACFAGMSSLRTLELDSIKLNDRELEFLETLPSLEEFDFDAGMLTTEEIAWICARYPNLYGRSLCAYNTEDAGINDVRVCGYRKPGLNLPEHQKRLDKYVAQFNRMVEEYKVR